MLLSFDIVPEAMAEHDEWHTHEHLPERLSIPGFVRGTRWKALRGEPGYFVMYEVAQLDTLTSDTYLERLNHPSPWTAKMMPHYRRMNRGFCSVTGSFGSGLGRFSLLMRFKPAAGAESSLRQWLLEDILPHLPPTPGIGSAHLLEGALAPTMTAEQRIRGADASVDWALFVTGYSQDALEAPVHAELGHAPMREHGAIGVRDAVYGMEYSLTDRDVQTAGFRGPENVC
jgi:hypothetical protein